MHGGDDGQLDLVGLDSKRREARGNEIVSLAGTTHLGGQPYLAGIVQPGMRPASARPERQNPSRNPEDEVGLQVEILLTAVENRVGRTRALALAALACLLTVLVVFAWPGAASSAPTRVIVLGQTETTPPASCPGKIVNNVEVVPCRVEGHVTGFQTIAGGLPQPYEAPFDGKIVAWSITLAQPSRADGTNTTDEVSFFNEFLGSPSQARLGVLRRIEGSRPPEYKLLRQSPLQILNPYFGRRVVFALDHPLTILQGQIAALTIPTWAPMFAFNIGDSNTWRGSRKPGECSDKADIQEGNPQQGVGKIKTYGCYYSNARLLYTATVVKTAP
jgi:hypothetical protein